MRVLVTGSRTWSDAGPVWYCLSAIARSAVAEGDTEIVIVHGSAPGADSHADAWVRHHRRNGVQAERHPADWPGLGKRAGFVRNKAMVDRGADICLAFIRDHSRGATQCAELAERAGIPVRVIEWDDAAGAPAWGEGYGEAAS